MRPYGLVLTALLLAGRPAGAQQTAPMPPAAPAQAPQKLDGYLLRWEQEMQKISTLSAQVARIDRDHSFDTTQKFVGLAQYMKAGTGPSALNLALLELKPDGRNEVAEKFVCTGTYLYQFLPAQKEIKAFELPRPKPGQVADDNFLSFLFGMKAEEARRRYEMKIDKEDQYYIYVLISPRFPADRADFTEARIVLNRDNFLPRQLWFRHPNKNEVTWDVPAIRTDVRLDRASFDAPRPPPGWKLVPVTRAPNPPPRVVRPNQ